MHPLPLARHSDLEIIRSWGALMDALPFYVLLVDERHRMLAWNAAMRREFDCEDPRGMFCPEVVHGQPVPFHGCPLEDAVQSGSAIEKELFDPKTNRWVLSSVYPTDLRTEDGSRIYLHFARDVTEQKAADLALAQSLEHHKALGQLLQRLRECQTPEQTVQHLIDTTLQLSWMSTSGAAAFLARGEELEVVHVRNLDREVLQECSRVPFGRCLCGSAASTRRPLLSAEEQAAIPLSPGHGDKGSHGHAVLPLIYEGSTLGVVNFYLDAAARLSPSQSSFLEAAVGVTAAALAEQQSRVAAREAQERAGALERRLLESVIASQEEERKRVARELHDDLGQALSALLLDLKTMSRQSGSTSSGEICERMDHAVRDLIGRVYALASDLRPSVLDDYGLDCALSRFVSSVARRTGLKIDYQFVCAPGLDPRLPSSVEVVLYRVTQEALSNAVKHAGARQVSVLCFRRADDVMLIVEDDGIGFDLSAARKPERTGGLGVLGMRERVALAAGELVVESAPGEGTLVKVTLPVSPLPSATVGAPSARPSRPQD